MTLTPQQTATADYDDILFDSTNNAAGIVQFASVLTNSPGVPTATMVAAQIAASPEANIAKYVDSLYSTVLGVAMSNANVAGLSYWVKAAEGMLTPAQINSGTLTATTVAFLDQSFINAAGTNLLAPITVPTQATASALVDQLYAQGLSTASPSPAGVTYWVNQYMTWYSQSGATQALQSLVSSFGNAASSQNGTTIGAWLSAAALTDSGSGATYGSAGPTAIVSLTTVVGSFAGGPGNDTFLGTYSDGGVGANTFNIGDTIAGNGGINTISIAPSIPNAATSLSDGLWANVTGIQYVTVQTGAGAQSITTGVAFEAAFAAGGVNLSTTSTDGAIGLNLSTFDGAATITAISGAGAQTITTGAGPASIVASTGAGAITVLGSHLQSVTATTTGAGAQTITSTGSGAVTISASDNSGAQTIVTGNGNSTVIDATVSGLATITVGNGSNTINLGGSNVGAVAHIAVGSGSNAITLTPLHTAIDTVTVAANGGSTTALTAIANLVGTDTITFSDTTASTTVLNLLPNTYASVAAGEAAALAVAQHGIAEFNLAGNEYIFQHGGASAITVGAADTLIELVGVPSIDVTGHYSLGVVTHA